jgi:hypothetical protein
MSSSLAMTIRSSLDIGYLFLFEPVFNRWRRDSMMRPTTMMAILPISNIVASTLI